MKMGILKGILERENAMRGKSSKSRLAFVLYFLHSLHKNVFPGDQSQVLNMGDRMLREFGKDSDRRWSYLVFEAEDSAYEVEGSAYETTE